MKLTFNTVAREICKRPRPGNIPADREGRKMNARVKKLWLEALRSGKYEQTRNRLNRYGMVCANGVLCVALKNDEEFPVTETPEQFRYKGVRFARYLPATLVADIGMTKEEERCVGMMNDEGGLPFAEIADWIEENIQEAP